VGNELSEYILKIKIYRNNYWHNSGILHPERKEREFGNI